jgi:hypothetical protein
LVRWQQVHGKGLEGPGRFRDEFPFPCQPGMSVKHECDPLDTPCIRHKLSANRRNPCRVEPSGYMHDSPSRQPFAHRREQPRTKLVSDLGKCAALWEVEVIRPTPDTGANLVTRVQIDDPLLAWLDPSCSFPNTGGGQQFLTQRARSEKLRDVLRIQLGE